MGIYLRNEEQSPSFTECFCYTGSDQHYTIPYSGSYTIEAKGAGSKSTAGGLAKGDFNLTAGDTLSIMVGQTGNICSCCCAYGFGGRGAGTGCNISGGGLSGVFTGCNAITACDSYRALVIGGGAGGGYNSTCKGGYGGGSIGGNGASCGLGTAGGGGSQTGHGSGGNVGANQFNGGNGSCSYGPGGGGGWRGGNGAIGDSSAYDDKGAGGGSGYVKSTATNPTLTQGGGATACNNGEVKITFLGYNGTEIRNVYLGGKKQAAFTPGEDTITYYKFNGDLNDGSDNGNNLSIAGGTVTYGTTEEGGKYAYFNSSTFTKYIEKSLDYSDSYTISFRAKAKKSGISYVMIEMWSTSGNEFLRIHPNVILEMGGDITNSVTLNTWYLLTYVREGASSKLYINGTQVGTGTPRVTSGTYTIRFRLNQVGNQTSTSYCADYYISELIRESKARTDVEILTYFENTKDDYGVS